MSSIRRFAALAAALAGAHATHAHAQERVFLDGFDPAVAFRETDQDLRDPHLFVQGIGCTDITDIVNNSQQTNIQTDGNADTFLDASYMHLLQPLDTVDGAIGTLDSLTARCTAPMASTSCIADGSLPTLMTYTAQTAGTCLAPVAGSVVHTYSPAIANATAPCFGSAPTTVTMNFSGALLTLHDARIGASYVGTPPTQLGNGLLLGFVTEADADATMVNVPFVGMRPLSSLLAGGTNSCQTSWNDKDSNNGTPGWWFYLNFSAAKVPYTP